MWEQEKEPKKSVFLHSSIRNRKTIGRPIENQGPKHQKQPKPRKAHPKPRIHPLGFIIMNSRGGEDGGLGFEDNSGVLYIPRLFPKG